MIFMLDANVIRHLVKQDRGFVGIVDKLNEVGTRNVVVSAIAAHELIASAINPKLTKLERFEIAAYLRYFHVLPFDERAADESALIGLELAKKGRQIGKMDMLIAGHARGLGFTLVTHNGKDFDNIVGLKKADWMHP